LNDEFSERKNYKREQLGKIVPNLGKLSYLPKISKQMKEALKTIFGN